MTLTEFLLARIAEDEAGARMHPREWWSSRLEVECEVKRQIVELHAARKVRRAAETLSGDAEFIEKCRICQHFPAQFPCFTLRWLALPYADHPDYDLDWRP